MGVPIIAFFFWFASSVSFAVTQPLMGSWQYIGYEFDGQFIPRPDPNLDLRFTFTEEGISKLKWSYSGDTGFCERFADFEVRPNNWLYQKITWVNPDNHISCSSDSDMKLGKESLTHFTKRNDQLLLDLSLGDKTLIYVLRYIVDHKD